MAKLPKWWFLPCGAFACEPGLLMYLGIDIGHKRTNLNIRFMFQGSSLIIYCWSWTIYFKSPLFKLRKLTTWKLSYGSKVGRPLNVASECNVLWTTFGGWVNIKEAYEKARVNWDIWRAPHKVFFKKDVPFQNWFIYKLSKFAL